MKSEIRMHGNGILLKEENRNVFFGALVTQILWIFMKFWGNLEFLIKFRIISK
jgi:hypothetical protein